MFTGLGACWLPKDFTDGLMITLIVAHYFTLIVFAVGFREPPPYMLQQRLLIADPMAADRGMMSLTQRQDQLLGNSVMLAEFAHESSRRRSRRTQKNLSTICCSLRFIRHASIILFSALQRTLFIKVMEV